MLDLDGLIPPELAVEGTGSGITIAVVDSGINFDHPHLSIQGMSYEVFWDDDGTLDSRAGPVRDDFGHGTCCAALIHALAPDAALIGIKVTGERATTDADRLSLGIRVAVDAGADLICVPMATETRVRGGLDRAVKYALEMKSLLVAADPGRIEALPAHSPGALGVQLHDGVDVGVHLGVVCADGRARPFGHGPSNFYGPSLSAARVSAACARFAEISNFRGSELMLGFKNLPRVI